MVKRSLANLAKHDLTPAHRAGQDQAPADAVPGPACSLVSSLTPGLASRPSSNLYNSAR